MKQNNCLISIFLGLRFRRVWCEMCKYRWMCNYADRRSLWKWNMCWYTWFFQMWMPFWIWDQASHDSSIQLIIYILFLFKKNKINIIHNKCVFHTIKFFRFVWISMSALRTRFYVAVGDVSILQVNNKHLTNTWSKKILDPLRTINSFDTETNFLL